ncbi:unnamed protein product [Albugo candida]|uniref:Uncharacterized protein n=1 Tax=Albugo candida TaxID=65357 RepID=A0A024FVH5_9STRA|nr:unnamed protein product [Albugo candida]|eukprot:CCI11168.1 unnamed protein product [Albugo candida]
MENLSPPTSRPGRGVRYNGIESSNVVGDFTEVIRLVQYYHNESISISTAMAEALRSLQPYHLRKASLELEKRLNSRGFLNEEMQ